MVIEKEYFSIFDSQMQTITCPVNTMGVMGRGLALDFKERYPKYFESYRIACEEGLFIKEGLHLFKNGAISILSFPTKHDWRYPSQIEYIKEGLELLAVHFKWYQITSVSLPALGCGLGQLKYTDVRACVHDCFREHPLVVELIAPRAY